MKRVVHITSVHTPFDSRILHRECKFLAKSGYEVFFIVPADFSEKIEGNVKILGVQKPGSRFKRPLIWLQIIRKIHKLKPDILHFHDPELLAILPVVRMLSQKKMKIVYDVHEYFIESIKDKFWIPLHLRKITAFFVSYFESFLGKWVDGQVFVTQGQIPYYSHWKTAKIVLHNYPDLNYFKPGYFKPENFKPGSFKPDNFKSENLKPGLRKKKDQDRRFTLVHIGSLYERRGIMTMLKAMRLLIKDGYDVHLVLGGVFESRSFRDGVEDFIRVNKLEANIDILGWIDYTKINEQLAEADAVWLAHYPSLQHSRQSISTKQLEAMLASLPVICSDLPSLTRFVDEAACGISVSPKDPAAHAEAIKKLYNNPGEAGKMGARGRLLILEKYNWQNEVRHLNNFYEALLTGKNQT
ncbi:MAG: glycosyltransferase family 4 protein [Proteobacteria bacterium]|nr:glycosyltransferase family 4 protein [Pseudomonadota bacterium]